MSSTKEREGKMKKIVIFLVVGLIMCLFLTGCEKTNETRKEIVTLRFLMFGDEPEDMDKVLEEFYTRTKDTLGFRIEMEWIEKQQYKTVHDIKITTNEPYDLVFDAKWINLSTMQERGAYADLEGYFHNPDYPGLQQAFSETFMESNRINGQVCAVPIARTYGSGIPCVYYRKDIAAKNGIYEIKSLEQLEQYLNTVLKKEKDIIPLLLAYNRGFYTLNINEKKLSSELSVRMVYPVTLANVPVAVQLDETLTKVEEIVIMGDKQENFEKLMKGAQYDFMLGRLEGNRAWRKYCENDSINQTKQEEMFRTGKGSAYISTLDDYEKLSEVLRETLPDAELGAYIINQAVVNMEESAISSDFKANNYVCIPKDSTHIEQTMQFLNWLFESRENHDLFELGIENVHWKAIGEDCYEKLETEEGKTYSFPGYALTWNRNYVRFASDLPEEIVQYKKYELQESTFYRNILSDFKFDARSVQSEIAKFKSIMKDKWTSMIHGILENPDEIMQKAVLEGYEVGLERVKEEIGRQLQMYLDEQNS